MGQDIAGGLMQRGIDTTRGGVDFFQDNVSIGGVRLVGDYQKDRGEIFYVHRTRGSDTNDGLNPERPFANLQAAVDACVADRGDFIIKLGAGVSLRNPSPVTMDKAGITLMASHGAGNSYWAENQLIYNLVADQGPCLTITQPCRIIGLEIWSNTDRGGSAVADLQDASIYINGDNGGYEGSFIHILGCHFPQWANSPAGITFDAGTSCRIESCSFEGQDTAGIAFTSSVRNPQNNHVIDCWFSKCGSGILHVNATVQDMLYESNKFHECTTPINFSGGGSDGLVVDNYFTVGKDSAYDEAIATPLGRGIAFAGNHYIET